MQFYSRYIVLGAASGALALGGIQALPGQLRASAAGPTVQAQAHQDTSTANYDTSATGKKNKAQGKHRGAPTDTALRAKPGVQTGPTDSAKKQRSSQGMADSMRDSTR